MTNELLTPAFNELQSMKDALDTIENKAASCKRLDRDVWFTIVEYLDLKGLSHLDVAMADDEERRIILLEAFELLPRSKEYQEYITETISLLNVETVKQMQHGLWLWLINRQVTSSLNLAQKGIDAVGAIAIAEALQTNEVLTELDLADNDIGSAGAIAIVQTLQSNTTLTSLNLKRTHIRDDGGDAIANMLESNSTLTYLNLSGNHLRCNFTLYLVFGFRNQITKLNHEDLFPDDPHVDDISSCWVDVPYWRDGASGDHDY